MNKMKRLSTRYVHVTSGWAVLCFGFPSLDDDSPSPDILGGA
jgi:hypothetical protein